MGIIHPQEGALLSTFKSVSYTWWLPSKEYNIDSREKRVILLLEKPDRHHFSQEIKVNIISDKSTHAWYDYDENGTLPLCSSYQKAITLVLTMKKKLNTPKLKSLQLPNQCPSALSR